LRSTRPGPRNGPCVRGTGHAFRGTAGPFRGAGRPLRGAQKPAARRRGCVETAQSVPTILPDPPPSGRLMAPGTTNAGRNAGFEAGISAITESAVAVRPAVEETPGRHYTPAGSWERAPGTGCHQNYRGLPFGSMY